MVVAGSGASVLRDGRLRGLLRMRRGLVGPANGRLSSIYLLMVRRGSAARVSNHEAWTYRLAQIRQPKELCL